MPVVTDFPMPRSNYKVRNNAFGKFKAIDFTVDDIGSDDQFIVPKSAIVTFQGVKYRWSDEEGTIVKVVAEPTPAPTPTPSAPGTVIYQRISLTPFDGATKIVL